MDNYFDVNEEPADPGDHLVQPDDDDLPELTFPRRNVWVSSSDSGKKRSDDVKVQKSVAKAAEKPEPRKRVSSAPVEPTDDDSDTKTGDKMEDDEDAASDNKTHKKADDDTSGTSDTSSDTDDQTDNKMQVDDDPDVEDVQDDATVDPEPAAPSSPPPPPPSQPRRSTRNKTPVPRASSALPQTQIIISDDAPADNALDTIEEDGENDVDEIARRSSQLDLLTDSQPVLDDGQSPISPFTFFPLTFPQISACLQPLPNS